MTQFEGEFRVDTKPIRGLDFTSVDRILSPFVC